MGTSSTDTGDTGDSTTSTPGLSRGLVAGLLAHGVRLPLVLGKALCNKMRSCGTYTNFLLLTVDLLDNIEPDRCSEDRG